MKFLRRLGGQIVEAEAAGGAGGYDHTQSTPASLWTINHNLGYRPSVSLLSVGGVEMEADVVHVSVNQVQVSFSQEVAGFARLV